MKIKIIALIMIITTLLICVGCDSGTETYQELPSLEGRMIKIHCNWNEELGTAYYRDAITDVVYFKIGSGISPLLNTDGTPILWSDIENAKENAK